MSAFYVYEHWRPDTDECFYVGKGSGPRAFNLGDRNGRHRAITNKLFSADMPIYVRIVAENLAEDDALRIEQELVTTRRSYGARLADGGRGATGYRHSIDARERISQASSGRTVSRETAEKIRLSKLGVPRPSHVMTALQAGAKARVQSPEEREKRRIRMTGTRHSDGVKAILSAQKLGNKNALGFKQTLETRERMKVAALLREERKRASVIQATT